MSDLNTNVHKSVNQFLIDAADAYIRKLEGSELTNEETPKSENCRYITREDLEKIRREIKEELQREMIIILGSALAGGRVIQMPEIRTEKNLPQNDAEEGINADATTIGLASSWG
ncbi:MAG: hypothetical protein J6B94_04380 [Lachnospiraceae bacterium]|nr:hypothetical protein [Lachnospiraceae bacterium]